LCDPVECRCKIVFYEACRQSNEANPHRLEDGLPFFVCNLECVVNASIDFDRESNFGAIEVENETAHRLLAAELKAG
jgi:hypothetical protein